MRIYADEGGKEPLTGWLGRLKDKTTRRRIVQRIDRMRLGNFGDHKGVGAGVFEMRLDFGAGYRVYFAEENETIVLLLCGGDKSTQRKDVEHAKQYWQHHKEAMR